MRWPWSPRMERRSAGGVEDYTQQITRMIESQAAGKVADAGRTAALEAAAGSLGRALASAEVDAEAWAAAIMTPSFLMQTGRDLIRRGESMSIIRGRDVLRLDPAASWHWESAGPDPETWTVRCTTYGPSTSTTEVLPASGVVFLRWAGDPGTPHRGSGPLGFASLTGRLHAETERSLADEAAGPIAHLVAVPDGGDSGDDDPHAGLRADIRGARGRAVLVETTSGGWDQGRDAAPRKDWTPSRLGPSWSEPMASVYRESYAGVLAACGLPVSLTTDADGTSQREAFRRYLTLSVMPIARLLESELSGKLETPVRFRFDALYAHDLQGRATSYSRLRAAGMDDEPARKICGLG